MGYPFVRRSGAGGIAWPLLASLMASGHALSPALAGDDPPKFWAVTGVASDDVLNMRDVPHGDSKKLATIPPGTRGLKNLGCLTPEPNFDRWAQMTPEERANAKLPWCRVEYRGQQGWVAARFLKPDG